MGKKVIFILLFLLVIAGFIGFWYYRETIFSKEILKLEILGPDKARMGEEIEYTVKYKNNGNFVLQDPRLIFELPDYSLTEEGKTRFNQNLEDIYPGGENFVKFKGRLLGKEGDLKIAQAWLSYKPKNISARYESKTTFTTKIDTVPITLTYDISSKIEKGKEMSYALNYFSNIDYPLENLSLKIDSVQGFDFKSAEPVSLDNSEWRLGTLNKSDGGRIKIKGLITADADQHLNFSAKLGMWQDGAFVVVKETRQEIQVIQPLLFISQQINSFSNYVASPGETLNHEVFFKNIGSTPFDNLFIIVRLEGQAYDLSTFKSPDGQARPNDNLIVFDSRQIPKLKYLGPQDEVKVEFSVKLKNDLDINQTEKGNLSVKNKIDVLDISQEFVTKISSKLDFWQKVYHSSINSIENSGPIPPKVNETTTYAVVWEVKNYLNNLKNVKIKTVLSQNIGLVDNIFPESQASNFSFDNKSREIVWLAGELSASSSTTLTFQIALMPSQFQRGRLADLIGQATVSGEDQFTGAIAQGLAPAVNSSLPDDKANSGGGIVQ